MRGSTLTGAALLEFGLVAVDSRRRLGMGESYGSRRAGSALGRTVSGRPFYPVLGSSAWSDRRSGRRAAVSRHLFAGRAGNLHSAGRSVRPSQRWGRDPLVSPGNGPGPMAGVRADAGAADTLGSVAENSQSRGSRRAGQP